MCPNLTYQRRNTLSHLCTESEQPHTARNVNLERSVKLNLDFEITDSARWKIFVRFHQSLSAKASKN